MCSNMITFIFKAAFCTLFHTFSISVSPFNVDFIKQNIFHTFQSIIKNARINRCPRIDLTILHNIRTIGPLTGHCRNTYLSTIVEDSACITSCIYDQLFFTFLGTLASSFLFIVCYINGQRSVFCYDSCQYFVYCRNR